MTFKPVAALIAYHAALDAHDVDLVETLMAENATYESAAIGLIEGRKAIISAMRKYFAAHTDHHAWDDSVQQTGPQSARAIWQLKATNDATGENYHRRGEEEVTFDAAGKVLRVVVVDI
jgi:mRNA-degrading endonuclease HigB of HigAB toxin-antitoxin module